MPLPTKINRLNNTVPQKRGVVRDVICSSFSSFSCPPHRSYSVRNDSSIKERYAGTTLNGPTVIVPKIRSCHRTVHCSLFHH